MNDKAYQELVQEATQKQFRKRKRIVGKVRPYYPKQAEREYIRIVNAYVRILNKSLTNHMPEIRAAAKAERNDSFREDGISDLIAKLRQIFDQIAKEVEQTISGFGLYDKIQKMAVLTQKLSIKEWKRQVKSALGIDLYSDYYAGEIFKTLTTEWVDNNVGLIKTIPQTTLGNMQTIALDGYRNGETSKTIAKKLQKEYGLSAKRARFIARDQIAKLNSNIAQQQQRDAGVTHYKWSASQDEKVRDSHKELDGKIFSWDEPPIVDVKKNRRCHPGEDYQCRCVALPVFDKETISLPIAMAPAGAEKP